MKTTRIALLALVLSGALVGVGSAATSVSAGIHIGSSGRATVDIGFFYDDLAPYGNWVQRPNYGWVWRPHAVASSWRPYQQGHWAWTDYGWTWISDEPYGWATYHYGRWYEDPEIGWSWVPGDEWAPSWVSWQEGGVPPPLLVSEIRRLVQLSGRRLRAPIRSVTARAVVPKKFSNLGFAQFCRAFLRERGCENCQPN